MDSQTLYGLGKVLAVVLTIASASIAVAANLPDLGLSRQAVAVLTVAQTGITTALLFLPQVNRQAGTVRGAGNVRARGESTRGMPVETPGTGSAAR